MLLQAAKYIGVVLATIGLAERIILNWPSNFLDSNIHALSLPNGTKVR